MRKIEEKLIYAIRCNTSFKMSNTERLPSGKGVFLHGNLIAYIDSTERLIINTKGWNTNVTRGRINAILIAHGLDRRFVARIREGYLHIYDKDLKEEAQQDGNGYCFNILASYKTII